MITRLKSLAALISAMLIVSATLMFARVEAPTSRPANELKPLVEFSGAHSRVDKTTYERITSLKEFRKAYLRHLGKDPERFDEYYNPDNVPTIDFDRCMVIAIFQGSSWNSAGVRVMSITEDSDRLLVRFDNRAYQTSGDFNTGDGGGRKVTAYGMFVLPRTDKAIVLEEDVNPYLRPPPAWKEVARFPSIASK
jgi:hypothetical protein